MNVICNLVVMAITTPAIAVLYKTSRCFLSYKCMTIQKSKMDAKLKMLMCLHDTGNVPAMINLLEASHATKKSPIDVYALHLVELTARASAMLIVHNAGMRSIRRSIDNRTLAQSNEIIKSFEKFVEHATNITVQPLTAMISPYPTMHEDICNLAEDKLITLIIVPFHKKQTVDGAMEAVNPALRHLNQNILANAPCSVGILIDKGHGGPDDREALAYGLRMAENSSANLTILRLVPGDEIKQSIKNNDTLKVISDMEREAPLDNEYITDFKLRTMGQKTIVYNEKVVNNVEETITSICSMDGAHNFFIVGRGQGIESILIAGLNEFSDCPELGAVGDLLASSDFATTGYVLVVQQYVGK